MRYTNFFFECLPLLSAFISSLLVKTSKARYFIIFRKAVEVMFLHGLLMKSMKQILRLSK